MADDIISVSWSQAKTFQRCPQQWKYKYLDRLQPKERKRAPYLGTWIHAALETHYREGDWKIGYKKYLKEWNSLFDEEREQLSEKHGPLPEAVKRIMKSYLWYWRNDGWKVLATEQEFEIEIGSFKYKGVKVIVQANGIVDLVVEDDEGLRWVVDHKTTSVIPDPNAFHAMDPQLMLYPIPMAQRFGRIAGIFYNYIKSKPATIPQLTAKTGVLSRRKINTDYPTALRALKSYGFDPADYSDFLRPLRKQSPFLKRYPLPREKQVTATILQDFIDTAKNIYKERLKKRHVRNITKDCKTMCSYHDLCRGELNGLDMSFYKKSRFELREKREEYGSDFDQEQEEAETDD